MKWLSIDPNMASGDIAWGVAWTVAWDVAWTVAGTVALIL